MPKPIKPVHYVRKDLDPSLSNMVVIHNRRNGIVKFFNSSGGYEQTLDEKDFDTNYNTVSEETIAQLSAIFKPVFAGRDPGTNEGMHGFHNDARWNGWLTPLFTRDVIERELEDGGYLNGVLIRDKLIKEYCFFFEGNYLHEMHFDDGSLFSPDYDTSWMRSIVRSASSQDEMYKAFDKKGISCERHLKTEIMVEGYEEPIEVYGLGVGWCWVDAFDYNVEPTPSASPAP